MLSQAFYGYFTLPHQIDGNVAFLLSVCTENSLPVNNNFKKLHLISGVILRFEPIHKFEALIVLFARRPQLQLIVLKWLTIVAALFSCHHAGKGLLDTPILQN